MNEENSKLIIGSNNYKLPLLTLFMLHASVKISHSLNWIKQIGEAADTHFFLTLQTIPFMVANSFSRLPWSVNFICW